jgi:two-component system OmpR family response regulator
MRILLVEDDRMIGEVVKRSLKSAAYSVDWVRDGNTAITTQNAQAYDLILLDLGLPGKDGFDVLQAVRRNTKASAVPVIVVTARDAVEDRIRGLDFGADDYVLKPFETGELLARVRAVMRRQNGGGQPSLTNGSIELNPVTREVFFKGEAISLPAREFALLRALLIRPGAILSRKELEDRIYEWGKEVESNAIEYLIHSLRKKLGNAAIKNVRGVGWMVRKEE